MSGYDLGFLEEIVRTARPFPDDSPIYRQRDDLLAQLSQISPEIHVALKCTYCLSHYVLKNDAQIHYLERNPQKPNPYLTNEINALIDSLFNLPSLGEHQLNTLENFLEKSGLTPTSLWCYHVNHEIENIFNSPNFYRRVKNTYAAAAILASNANKERVEGRSSIACTLHDLNDEALKIFLASISDYSGIINLYPEMDNFVDEFIEITKAMPEIPKFLGPLGFKGREFYRQVNDTFSFLFHRLRANMLNLDDEMINEGLKHRSNDPNCEPIDKLVHFLEVYVDKNKRRYETMERLRRISSSLES